MLTLLERLMLVLELSSILERLNKIDKLVVALLAETQMLRKRSLEIKEIFEKDEANEIKNSETN